MVVKAEIMMTALLDRLTHKAHILEFAGESSRFRQWLRQEEQQSGEGKTETG
jgi:IstB-like ATP binding protein